MNIEKCIYLKQYYKLTMIDEEDSELFGVRVIAKGDVNDDFNKI